MAVSFNKSGIVNASGIIANDNLLRLTPKSVTPTAYCACQLKFDEKLVANQSYTMQLWDVNVSHSEKSEAALGVWIYWGGGSVSLFDWHGTNYFTDGHADYLVKTFTPTETQVNHSNAANLWFNVYNSVGYVAGTLNLTIGRWKLEKGNIATPWSFNINDDNYIPSIHGFVEDNDHMSVYPNHIQTPEFIEY